VAILRTCRIEATRTVSATRGSVRVGPVTAGTALLEQPMVAVPARTPCHEVAARPLPTCAQGSCYISSWQADRAGTRDCSRMKSGEPWNNEACSCAPSRRIGDRRHEIRGTQTSVAASTRVSPPAARSLASRLLMHGRIGRHGCHQPGRGGADVCALRCSGELAQVFEIVLGDLADCLTTRAARTSAPGAPDRRRCGLP
jgi:hypothetical protein